MSWQERSSLSSAMGLLAVFLTYCILTFIAMYRPGCYGYPVKILIKKLRARVSRKKVV